MTPNARSGAVPRHKPPPAKKGLVMPSTSFLRRVLALDALSCAAMGLVMAPFATGLAPLLGLPAGLVQGAGLLLLPLAAFIGWLATRSVPPRALVWVVILGNVAWSVESAILLAQYAEEVTALGTAFVAAQAAAVLALSALEYIGLRRVRATA
jgi:hypothetical protein